MLRLISLALLLTSRAILTPPHLEATSIGITNLTLNSVRGMGGEKLAGRVAIDNSAPAGGITITLSSDKPDIAAVPTILNIPAGAKIASFVITTSPVASDVPVIITAVVNDSRCSTTLVVKAPTLMNLQFNTSRITGGLGMVGLVSLNGKAPREGIKVGITSTNPPGINPALGTLSSPITIAPGARSATFSFLTQAVAIDCWVTLEAVANKSHASATLEIEPPVLDAIRLSHIRTQGGRILIGEVMLNGKAPQGGIVVHLACAQSPLVKVPSNVTVSPGARSAPFKVSTSPVRVVTNVLISATASTTSTTTLAITPAETGQVTASKQ